MHSFLRLAAERQHGVVCTRDLVRAGIGPQEVRRLVDAGAWVRLRRGAFVATDVLAAADAEGRRPVLEASAVVLTLARPSAVLSGLSAARVWGLPTPRRLRGTVTLTDPTQHRRGRGYEVTHAPLPPGSTTTRLGLPVTTLARTVVDCAREWTLEEALILTDAARWGGRLAEAELAEALVEAAGQRGVAAARRVADLSCDGADSPLETRTRLRLVEASIEIPQLQVVVVAGPVTWEADGLWRRQRVLMACDGRVKYRDPWGGRTTEQAHWAEKRQREALIAAGLRFWTVVDADLDDQGWPRALDRLVRLLAQVPPGPPLFRVLDGRRRRPRAG